MIWTWLEEAFTGLPGCNDDIFKGLWLRGRLKFGEQAPDCIDEYSARLLCAALRHYARLFIVLPDSQDSRPALLFATALIRSWYDASIQQKSSECKLHRQKILYFGSAIGVRRQLSQVRVEGKDWKLNLSEVFQQQDIGKKKQKVRKSERSKKFSESQHITLPEVITVYSPVDPIAILEKHKPQWIAIDCDDAERLRWLKPLLKSALEKHLTVLAWGQNPLSECVSEFAEYGQVFTWLSHQPILEFATPSQPNCKLQPYLCPDKITQIQPVIVEGTSAEKLATSLYEANRLLVSAFKIAPGRFAKDAIRVHWKYLRTLELLSVPFEFYEAEAHYFWGLKSLKQLSDECEHFREACSQNSVSLSMSLEQVHTSLLAATEHIRSSTVPQWKVLCDLITKEPFAEEVRFIIFSSQARKKLFLLALLAKHNCTEKDLHAVRTWIFSLDEIQKLKHKNETHSDIATSINSFEFNEKSHLHYVVGLPSPLLMPKLLPILLQEKVCFLLYSYQTSALARQVDQWSKRLSPDISIVAKILGQLSGIEIPLEFPKTPSKLTLVELSGLDVGNITKPKSSEVKSLWQPEDPVNEIARLLGSEQSLLEDEVGAESRFFEDSETRITLEQESWCESAIEVQFEHGWCARFAPDDIINIIITNENGQQIDKRYVRSLKTGDRVIAIPEQRRQSLYDLILSRVHGHSTIELHLALIRRWQQDLELAYRRWRLHGVRNLDELLCQMQRRGSRLTHPMTLRGWLSGSILCPEDPKDLHRIAEILGMEFVETHYHRIDKAAKRLRSLHRVLARRLNGWLEEQASGSAKVHGNDILDAELGITFSDFRNSLLILRVQHIYSIAGLFSRSGLGKFERSNLE